MVARSEYTRLTWPSGVLPDGDDHHGDALLDEKKKAWTWTRGPESLKRSTIILFWIVSLLVVAILSSVATLYLRSVVAKPAASFAAGWSTEFAPALSSISIKRERFSGSPTFDQHGHGFIPEDSPSYVYTGDGIATEKAWEELVADRYFLLSDEEAEAAFGRNYTQFWNGLRGGYLAGLDATHLLHCLNHIRKALLPGSKPNATHEQVHQRHCIEVIRQSIQCKADLTIIPTRWQPTLGQNYIDSDRVHVCRDFSRVRKWVTSRTYGPAAVKPRHPDGTVRDRLLSADERGLNPADF